MVSIYSFCVWAVQTLAGVLFCGSTSKNLCRNLWKSGFFLCGSKRLGGNNSLP
jgi:hypothetical protein